LATSTLELLKHFSQDSVNPSTIHLSEVVIGLNGDFASVYPAARVVMPLLDYEISISLFDWRALKNRP
jgi:hypothetical protein